MGMEIDGLDDPIKMNEDVARGLSAASINEYCEKVKQAARECGIKEQGELELEAVLQGKEFEIKFGLKDRSKADCIKEAIRRVMPSMTVTTRAVFEQIMKQLADE